MVRIKKISDSIVIKKLRKKSNQPIPSLRRK